MAKVCVGPHPLEQKARPAHCDSTVGCWRWHYWWDRTSVSRAVEAWNSDFLLAFICWGMTTFGEVWWGALSRREWSGGTGVSLALLAKQPGASFELKCVRWCVGTNPQLGRGAAVPLCPGWPVLSAAVPFYHWWCGAGFVHGHHVPRWEQG